MATALLPLIESLSLGMWIAESWAMPEATQRKRLVLLVDDDARATRALAELLRQDGYDVETALDGAAAIGRLSKQPTPDALVTDLRMPYVGGMEVAKFARRQASEMPIFFVTGYPELVVGLDERFDPLPVVLSKPLFYNQFTEELRRPFDSEASG